MKLELPLQAINNSKKTQVGSSLEVVKQVVKSRSKMVRERRARVKRAKVSLDRMMANTKIRPTITLARMGKEAQIRGISRRRRVILTWASPRTI